MSKITGYERSHWHDAEGRHRMRDMRTVPGYPEKFWDDDERAYIRHLVEHENLGVIPRPDESDSEAVKALFGVVETAEKIASSARELIVGLRLKDC